MPHAKYVRWFEELRNDDVPIVGGKNASLGEMIGHLREGGVRVPGGFATTAGAYRAFLRHNRLEDTLRNLTGALSRNERSLQDMGMAIRRAIRHGKFPDEIARQIRDGYRELSSDRYKDGFALECRAVRRAREVLGLENTAVMIPFVRTPEEADKVIPLFDEQNEAVKLAIAQVIERAHAAGCKVGICGQAPSDYPEFALFLVERGIDSISLNPDSVLDVLQRLAKP